MSDEQNRPIYEIPPAGSPGSRIDDVYPVKGDVQHLVRVAPVSGAAITALERPIDLDLVREVELLLDDVKAGRVVGMMIVAEKSDLVIFTAAWGLRNDELKMMGHLQRLIHRINREMDNSSFTED